MADNRAIVIGINKYHFLQPLKYAERDAKLFSSFLATEAGFTQENIFLFTSNSPNLDGKSTKPFRSNLVRVLRQISDRLSQFSLKEDDNFWFFFSGHGIRHCDRDYLMPLDGDPEDVENTGISIHDITDYLRHCNVGNVVLILDACRSQGIKGEGIGRQTETEVRSTGIISIFSCQPNQSSYEVDTLQQGAFTFALLEGLGAKGRCATVKQLNHFLKRQVPTILEIYSSASSQQIPYIIAEPIERSHALLMPKYATPLDISALKNDAYRAEYIEQLDIENQLISLQLAEQCWLQVNAVTAGQDNDAIKAIQRLGIKMMELKKDESLKYSEKYRLNDFLSHINQTSKNNCKSLKNPSSFQSGNISCSLPERDLNPDQTLSTGERTVIQEVLDYNDLKRAFKNSNWREADSVTYQLILEAVGKDSESCFTASDQLQLPCAVIFAINQLWFDNSEQKFGFCVQQKIWCSNDVGGQAGKFSNSVFRKFSDHVGWRKNDNWLSGYDDFNFSVKAPAGHLPTCGYALQRWDNWRDSFHNLFPYICTCFLNRR